MENREKGCAPKHMTIFHVQWEEIAFTHHLNYDKKMPPTKSSWFCYMTFRNQNIEETW